MKIIFLGTNGWYSTKTGNTVCALIESEKYYIIFDAGDGISKINRYIKKNKEIFLFLSHLHLDHIIGFHSLAKLKHKKPFNIFVPKGMKKLLESVIRHPFAMSFKEFRDIKVNIFEFPKEKDRIPFSVNSLKLCHIDPSFGYRIELDGKSIVYCSDTGVCDNSLKLSLGADVLIHECSNKSGVFSGKWGHSNPEEAATLAKKAKVKKLLLTHFSANSFTFQKDRKMAELKAKKIFKNTKAAKDGMVVKI